MWSNEKHNLYKMSYGLFHLKSWGGRGGDPTSPPGKELGEGVLHIETGLGGGGRQGLRIFSSPRPLPIILNGTALITFIVH